MYDIFKVCLVVNIILLCVCIQIFSKLFLMTLPNNKSATKGKCLTESERGNENRDHWLCVVSYNFN